MADLHLSLSRARVGCMQVQTSAWLSCIEGNHTKNDTKAGGGHVGVLENDQVMRRRGGGGDGRENMERERGG